MGPRYLEQLKACRESCARNVTGNLLFPASLKRADDERQA